MILRSWTAKAFPNKTKEFEDFQLKFAFPILQKQEGMVKVIMGKDVSDGVTKYLVTTIWKDLESMKKFTGEKWQEPVMHPDEEPLLDGKPRLEHFEVTGIADL